MNITSKPDLLFRSSVDPVTFEILHHRLWQINDEQGATIKRISGSPVATEVHDFNVGIASADGQLVVAGLYLLAHVTGLSEVIDHCVKTIGRDRIRPGDVYVTNDPWMGAVHQNDVALVSPLHADGEIIGWTGTVIHQSDIGGPVPGSWNLNAYDAYQEAPRYRFLRIVDEGRPAPEVITTITTNSRFPDLVDLDLRAQIAAAAVARDRMQELLSKYGVATVKQVMSDCLTNSEIMLRRRLLEIPDGEFYAESHVDHDGHEDTITTVRLSLTKRADQLIFDFTETDAEASGLINCPRPALMSAPFSSLLTYLCEGIPWNEGIMRCVEVRSTPGSAVDCNFPAPVASGIVNTAWAALNASCAAIGRMLLQSDKHRDKSMAVWAGAPYGVNVFGQTDAGARFGTLLGLSGLQGAGARTFADGYDVAGYLHSPRCGAMNVETAEANYPILHLCRERAHDTGGPGVFRGGVGVRMAITPHQARNFEVVTTTFGSDQSGSAGIAGGYPGGGANAILLRQCKPLEALRRHQTSELVDAVLMQGEALPSKARFSMEAGDTLLLLTHGGGGFGDPLGRDIARVAADVADGSVSDVWAKVAYGVVLDDAGAPDHTATARLRARLKKERLDDARAGQPRQTAAPRLLTSALANHVCLRCQGSPDRARPHAVRVDRSIGAAGPALGMRWKGESHRFRLTLAVCSACGSALETVQIQQDEPLTRHREPAP